jgi:hypothetical protein
MGKIMKLIAAPLLVFMLGCTRAHAQVGLDALVEANMMASIQNLRKAIIHKRDVYSESCKRYGGNDCDVASLADVQILLLDIEHKYRQHAASSSTSEASKKAKATQNIASEARDLVNSLAESLK